MDNGITMIKLPPYSPDLAPSDIWLIDYVKSNLDDQPDEKALDRAVTWVLKNMLIEEYQKTFEKWVEGIDFCIEVEGDYFEHFI